MYTLTKIAIGPPFFRTACPLIALSVACVALLPKVQAVVPAPDGGYPNFTTAEGQNALQSLSSGGFNTAVGAYSLFSTTTTSFNTATGAGTLLSNTGDNNTATGALALLSNTTGISNTAIGALALVSNSTGFYNTAIGRDALYNNTTGYLNTAIGETAGYNIITGHDNICIGRAVYGLADENGTTRIGEPNGSGSEACYIAGIYGKAIDPATTLAVGMDASHRLGTAVLSSERFKRDIQPMGEASEAILALKPVMFHYRSDVKSTPCFGLVAEDVEKVNPHLIVRDKHGQPLSVRYEQINAMLLNEFLKEHRKNEDQGAKIAQQQEAIKALEAELKEQAAQIQKVSAELELSRSPPQTVLND